MYGEADGWLLDPPKPCKFYYVRSLAVKLGPYQWPLAAGSAVGVTRLR